MTLFWFFQGAALRGSYGKAAAFLCRAVTLIWVGLECAELFTVLFRPGAMSGAADGADEGTSPTGRSTSYSHTLFCSMVTCLTLCIPV